MKEPMSDLNIEIPEVKKNSTRTRENGIVKDCLTWANCLPGAHFYKRKAGPNRKGQPDISGAVLGVRVEIEIKAPGNTPTELQIHKLKVWQKAGCISGWCDCLQEFKLLIRQGLIGRGVNLNERYFA